MPAPKFPTGAPQPWEESEINADGRSVLVISSIDRRGTSQGNDLTLWRFAPSPSLVIAESNAVSSWWYQNHCGYFYTSFSRDFLLRKYFGSLRECAAVVLRRWCLCQNKVRFGFPSLGNLIWMISWRSGTQCRTAWPRADSRDMGGMIFLLMIACTRLCIYVWHCHVFCVSIVFQIRF